MCDSAIIYWQLPLMSCLLLTLPCRRPFAHSAEAIEWAVEVAAKQLIQQRLRTHYGGAVQTLAAIEKGLQARLSKCNQSQEHQQATPGTHRLCCCTRICRLSLRSSACNLCRAKPLKACAPFTSQCVDIYPGCWMILKGPSLLAGLLGGSALLDFALALERQIQSACFGTLALPSAAVDPESQSFFAAPRNQMVSCPHILPLS